MTKTIHRPMGATSKTVEIIAHLIKDREEMKNVLERVVKPEQVIVIRKLIDERTFQPQILFMLRHVSKDFGDLFYIGNIEHFVDNGREDLLSR